MNLNYALCTGIGAVIVGTGGFLMQKFGINKKIIDAIKGGKADTVITGHPKATEALDALEQAGLDVLKDLVTAHPEVLDVIEAKLAKESVTEVGAYLAATYGPEIVADVVKRGEALIGTELKLIFGGSKAVEEVAVQRIGVAASNNVQSLKTIVTLPSGAKLVKPAA